MNYTYITNELINYLNTQHQKNINTEAFSDIANVLLDFHYHQNELYTTKWVCNASMGHGKTTVITSYLKWNKTKPILLCVKEKQLAHEIYTEVKQINPSIINVNADNKELVEMDIYKYQIVIIQHERLKNLTLKFGNMYNYQYYIKNGNRIKRNLIIDERPPFHDSVTYDITSHNNVLEWFDNLSQPFKFKPLTIQKYKSYVTYLVSSQLADNASDITDTLIKEEDWNSIQTKELISFLNEMRDHPDNTDKYNSLNALKHFKKLLKTKGYGRIDDVSLYHKEKAISDNQIHLYRDNKANQTKGLNLLNTTGKNALNNVTTLYIPCLPKRNAEHYKEIAIALYGSEVSLLTSQDNDNGNWFQDEKLERVYQLELYAELLQIIHRTALRKINSNEIINIYLTYNDVRESASYSYVPLLDNLNKMYMDKQAIIAPVYKLYSMYDYGRDKKLDSFIGVMDNMDIDKPVPVGEVSQSLRKYLKNHYSNKKELINFYFKNSGYEILEVKDRYSDNSKYIKKIK